MKMRAAFWFIGAALPLSSVPVHAANANTVRVTVISKIEEELGVYWINTWKQGELVRQKEEAIVSRGNLNVDSFFGHSFLVVDEKHTEGLTRYEPSVWNPAIMSMFTMGEFDLEVRVTRAENGELKTDLESALTRTSELMSTASEKCRQSPAVTKAAAKRRGLAAAEGSCAVGSEDSNGADEMSAEFAECLTKAIAEDLAKKESESNKSMRMLEIVGDVARNYTCVDPDMQTTNTSLSATSWKDPQESGKTYNAQMYLDEPAAKIYLLDDFATDAECQALMNHATPHLQDATVDGGAGKFTLSPARRAKAGGVNPDLDNPKSPTADLYRRGYAFANHVTGYGLPLAGQEGFSVIKYGSDDEYRPHCDGDCTGAEFQAGGRVATMVIYCEQATVGGGTTFSSSNVFINGKKGQAVFFSYLGPDNRTDKGRTRHSGCPIVKGTKWIATLWMRRGVTAERGWQYYDPSGQPSAMAMAQKKGTSPAQELASAQAQTSAVDGAETASLAGSETIQQKEAEDDGITGHGQESATAAAAKAAVAEGEGEAGILGGIAGTISSLFS